MMLRIFSLALALALASFGVDAQRLPSPGAGALSPVVTAAISEGRVIKATAGNLYGFEVTSQGTAGYVMIFNAASTPADGAVTPVKCYKLAANATSAEVFNPPLFFSTGITIVYSSTGCFTKTGDPNAFISGDAQ